MSMTCEPILREDLQRYKAVWLRALWISRTRARSQHGQCCYRPEYSENQDCGLPIQQAEAGGNRDSLELAEAALLPLSMKYC